MEWTPDIALLRGLIGIIDDAFSKPNSITNQKMVDTTEDLNSQPDGILYLCEIFKSNEVALEIRNSAGYLMKKRILLDRSNRTLEGHSPVAVPPVSDAVLTRVATVVIDRLSDAEEFIRTCSGSILSALLLTWPSTKFQGILGQIHANCLADTTTSYLIREASWSAGCKILEDVLDRCADTLTSADDTMSQFAEAMLSASISYCSKSRALHQTEAEGIASALRCANKIAHRSEYLDDILLERYADNFLQTLGICAEVPDDNVQIEVIRGMNSLLEYHPKSLLASEYSNSIGHYLVAVTSHQNYEVKFESILIWPKILRHQSELVKAFIGDRIGVLCVSLLKNFCYVDKDFCQMDPSQFAADDANTPDDISQIAPQFPTNETTRGMNNDGFSSENDSDDDDYGDCRNTWGSDWTLRKGSALTLDNLSGIYHDSILQYVLPTIEGNLQDVHWETQEAAVLALGALAPNCLIGLADHLPMVTEMLLTLIRHQVPLVRSISVWALGRLRAWYTDLSVDTKYISSVINAVLECCLDRNKTVQQAAVSSLSTIFDAPPECLLEFVSPIGKALNRALDTYQEKNLLILCETTTTLVSKMSTCLTSETSVMDYLLKFTAYFCNMSIERPSFTSFCEALSTMISYLDDPYTSQCYEPLFRRSAEIIISLTQNILNYPDPNLTSGHDNDMALVKEDTLASSIDLLTSVIIDIRNPDNTKAIALIEGVTDFVPAIVELCVNDKVKHYHPLLRTTVYALCGDFASLPGLLSLSYADKLLPDLIEGINCHLINSDGALIVNYHQNRFSMAQNAIWALGEFMLIANIESVIQPRLSVIVRELSNGLSINHRNVIGDGRESRQHLSLVINIFQVVMRLGVLFPSEVGQLIIETELDVSAITRTIATVRLESFFLMSIQGLYSILINTPQLAEREVRNVIEMIALCITGRGNSDRSPLTNKEILKVMEDIKDYLILTFPATVKSVVGLECTTVMQELILNVINEDQKKILAAN